MEKISSTTKNNTSKKRLKSIFITKINISDKSTINNESMISKNELLKKSNEFKVEEEELKKNFLEYLINENPRYANLETITADFKRSERKLKEIYDRNLMIIKKKKKLLHALELKINQVVIDNVLLSDKDMENYYDHEIFLKKEELKRKEHELEMYHQLFNRVYKINYKLSNKLEIETKYAKMYNQQYEKYCVIKNASLIKIQKQQEMLKSLNSSYENFITNNENAINEKSKELNQVEYEVYMIKNDIIGLEKGIEALKEKKKKLSNLIVQNNHIYEQKAEDLLLIKQKYFKDFIKMEDIYQVLKIDNVNEILRKYNRLSQEYNNRSLLLKMKSIELTDLNSTLKKDNDTLKDIKKQIKILKHEILSKSKVKNDIEEQFMIQKKQIKYFVSQIYDILKEKIHTFTMCLNNALLNIYKIRESMDKAAMKSPFSYNLKFTDRFNCFLNDDMKSINVDFEKEYDEKQMLLFVIILIKSLNCFLFQIKSNISYSIYNKIIEEEEIEKVSKVEDSHSNYHISSVNVLVKKKEKPKLVKITNKVDIFSLKNESIQQFFEKELKYSVTKLNEKKVIYSRSVKEILKNKISKNYINSNEAFINKRDISNSNFNDTINVSRKSSTINNYTDKTIYKKNRMKKILMRNNTRISKEDFYKLYYAYYQKSFKENKKSDIKIPEIKFRSFYSNRFAYVNQFLNDNVNDQVLREKLKEEKKELIHKKSEIIKSKIEEKELMDFMNKKKKQEGNKKINSEDDLDVSFEKEKEEKEKERLKIIHKELEEWKKKKKFKIKSREPQMNVILERLDDIRALELHYANNNKNILDSIFFNEYYFKLKKQLNLAQKSARNINMNLNINFTSNVFNKKAKTPNRNTLKHIEKNNSVLLDKKKLKKLHNNNTCKHINEKKTYFKKIKRETLSKSFV